MAIKTSSVTTKTPISTPVVGKTAYVNPKLTTKPAVKPIVPRPVDPLASLQGELNAMYDPVLAAGRASTTAQRAGLGLDFEELKKRLREVAGQSEAGLTESMSRYGLLESGRTAAGIGKIQENLSSDIGKADIQRAIAEANLVLEGASFEADVRKDYLGQLTGGTGSLRQIQLAENLQKFNIDLTKFKTFQDFYADPFNIQNVPSDLKKSMLESLGYTVT
jgi:hypothetical protein